MLLIEYSSLYSQNLTNRALITTWWKVVEISRNFGLFLNINQYRIISFVSFFSHFPYFFQLENNSKEIAYRYPKTPTQEMLSNQFISLGRRRSSRLHELLLRIARDLHCAVCVIEASSRTSYHVGNERRSPRLLLRSTLSVVSRGRAWNSSRFACESNANEKKRRERKRREKGKQETDRRGKGGNICRSRRRGWKLYAKPYSITVSGLWDGQIRIHCKMQPTPLT